MRLRCDAGARWRPVRIAMSVALPLLCSGFGAARAGVIVTSTEGAAAAGRFRTRIELGRGAVLAGVRTAFDRDRARRVRASARWRRGPVSVYGGSLRTTDLSGWRGGERESGTSPLPWRAGSAFRPSLADGAPVGVAVDARSGGLRAGVVWAGPRSGARSLRAELGGGAGAIVWEIGRVEARNGPAVSIGAVGLVRGREGLVVAVAGGSGARAVRATWRRRAGPMEFAASWSAGALPRGGPLAPRPRAGWALRVRAEDWQLVLAERESPARREARVSGRAVRGAVRVSGEARYVESGGERRLGVGLVASKRTPRRSRVEGRVRVTLPLEVGRPGGLIAGLTIGHRIGEVELEVRSVTAVGTSQATAVALSRGGISPMVLAPGESVSGVRARARGFEAALVERSGGARGELLFGVGAAFGGGR